MQSIVSIDLETTGLDPINNQILEVGIIIDNGLALDRLPTFRCIVQHEKYRGSAYALALNHEILHELSFKEDAHTVDEVVPAIRDFLQANDVNPLKFIAAGKNIGSFDIQFLKQLPGWGTLVKPLHGYLDPGPMYWEPGDVGVPGLSKCKKRAGLPPTVTHKALEDAFDVVKLIRYKHQGE